MRARIDGRGRFVLLFAIVLLGLGFRLWGVTWGLHNADVSRRPHPDEWVVYWLWQWFGAKSNLDPCPDAHTRCFFDWGSVYIYLAYGFHLVVDPAIQLLPASAFGSHADPTFVRFVLAGRLFSVLLSTFTIVLLYRLGSAMYGVGAGLLAALFLALCALLIQIAHFATPDATTTLLVTAVLLSLWLARSTPSTLRFSVAGALIGVATGTEYHMALLTCPLVCAWLLTPGRRSRWVAAAAAGAVAAFLITNPYVLIHPTDFVSALEHTVRIRTVDNYAQYQGRFDKYGPGWLYVLHYDLGYGVGYLLAILMVVGVMWSIWRRRASDLFLLSWTIPYFLLVSYSSVKYLRYSAPLLPALALLAANFSWEAVRVRGTVVRRAAIALVTLAALLGFAYDGAYAGLFTQGEPRAELAQWISAHATRGSSIGFEQLPNGLINLAYFVTDKGYRPCVSQFKLKRLSGPMEYYLLDDYELEEHPRITASAVSRFQEGLQLSAAYREVYHIHHQPTFLGLTFPIDGSPHDWRYMTHDLVAYRQLDAKPTSPAYCFPGLASASRALNVSGPKGT